MLHSIGTLFRRHYYQAMRIWHQSFTDLDEFPLYRNTLAAHAAKVMGDRVEVTVHGLLPGTYPKGVAPMDVNSVGAMRLLGETQVCEAALAAQNAGYDAVGRMFFRYGVACCSLAGRHPDCQPQ